MQAESVTQPVVQNEPSVIPQHLPSSVDEINQQQSYLKEEPHGDPLASQTYCFPHLVPHPVPVNVINTHSGVSVPLLIPPDPTIQAEGSYTPYVLPL